VHAEVHNCRMPSAHGLRIVDRCVVCELRNESFFCSLPAAVLQEFEKLKVSMLFRKGTLLFSEGEKPGGIHMLCQGEVRLSTTLRDGRSVVLKFAQPGEILGLSSCISALSYDLTAKADTTCQANFVKRQDFLRFLREHGEACLRAAECLGAQLQDVVAVVRTLAKGHRASERLAKFLLSQDAEGANRVALTLTQREIAEAIATSRETVSRMLGEFKKANLIAVDGKRGARTANISIRDRAAMQKLFGT